MKRFVVGLSMLLLFMGSVQAEQTAKAYSLFYAADWCTSCKILEPKLTAVKPSFNGKPIEFLRIDLTNSETAEASLLKAQALGLGDIARQNAKATGYVLLVNADSKQIVGRIYSSQSEQQIKQKLQLAIDS